jgi:trimeric autotransporter adhesin
MSTKTTFKRVALVAVAALGFGVLTSVAPATAGNVTPSAIVVGTIPTAQVGVANVTPITVTAPYTAGGSDSFTVNVRVTSAPAGSAFAGLATASKLIDGSTVGSFVAGTYAAGSTVGAQLTVTIPTTNTGTLGTSALVAGDKMTVGSTYASPAGLTANSAGNVGYSFRVNLTPDKAGTYSILVSTNAGATIGAYVAGDTNTTYSVSTAAATTKVALAAVTGSSFAGTTSNGQIFKATITDAAGVASQLGAGETITLASDKTTTNIGQITATNGAISFATPGVASVLDSGDFTNGVAYFAVKDATGTAVVAAITATGSGLLASTITSSITATTVAAVGTTTTGTIGNPASAVRPGSGHVGIATAGATVTDTAATTATSHSYLLTLAGITAATKFDTIVTDTSGKITGVPGLVYSASATSGATGLFAIGVTATLSTAGQSFIWSAVLGTTNAQVTVTSATAAADTTALTGGTPTTISQAHSASSALTAVVKDQFGAAVANSVVTISTTGRNASTTNTTLATDANGRVTYTRADAGTAASANKQDVVTFDGAGATNPTVTINYGSVAVGTITCTNGNELDTATSVTYRDIDSNDGAEVGALALCTVTVKDANGAIMVGVPVTTTTTSAGAAVLSTSATLYTGSAGTVSPSVYAWTTGAKTFTVTAGAVTNTETVNYRQETAAEVRSISVKADGNRHLVTAMDRFGNVVPGVRIYGTRTGNGLFGGGAPTANAITANPSVVDANTGVAEFIFNSGSADSVVKYQVASAADTPSATFGYTAAVKGSSDDGTTALTASTVGTVFLAEAGVGASFDAAGVNSVTATIAADTAAADTAQAAVDAAAEATDAANAATDAANAAAEAADAATAAAQDAADAVAALSTQVSEMVSALKKQITALTNLVIKIQKKVNA